MKCLILYRRHIALGVCLLLFVVSLQAQTNRAIEATKVTNLRWLVAGAFNASGENALFKNYLDDGETQARPKENEAAGNNENKTIKWQIAEPSENGEFDFGKIWNNQRRAIGYAYTEIQADTGKYLVATAGSGLNLQVWLNGEVIYESRLSRKSEPDKDTIVLPLRKGANRLLIKTEGNAGNWKLQLKIHQPDGKIFVNQRNTIVPDFRVGERVKGVWGQVEIANVSGTALKGVAVELLGDDFVMPSRSAEIDLSPHEVQRIPFWITGKAVTPEDTIKPLQIRVSAEAESFNFGFTPRIRKPAKSFVTTYRSFVDGSVQPFSVLLPTAYKPQETYPLILLLHGAHVTDWGQNIVAYEPKEWAIQVAVHDRGNNRYRDIGEVDIDEVLAEAKRRYRIDSDRIYLAGHSMGGYGTWFQATHRPDLWASVSPQAGYADYFLYHPAMSSSPDSEQRFQKRLLESWSPLWFAENLLHIPAYVVHGAKDNNVSVEHSRKMAARLKEFGYKFEYYENAEGGHWWGPKGKKYGTEIVDNPKIWEFLRRTKQRADAPRKVIYKTDSLHYRKAYWVTIDELEKANHISRIEAEITAPNQISVKLENVQQLTLNLDEKLVEINRPVTIKINNRTAFQGALPNSNRLTIRTAEPNEFIQIFDKTDLPLPENSSAERFENLAAELDSDGQAARFFAREKSRLQKTPEIYGGISDAFNTPFLLVVGTKGRDAKSNALNEAARRAAESLVCEWMMRAEGIAEIKRDVDVTSDDINSRNLILFGNANTNAMIAEINGKLPLRFDGANLVANGQKISGADLGMILIAPNPLQTNRYAVIIGGTTPNSFKTASRLNFNELPDFVLFDKHTLAGEKIDFLGGGFFNKFWELGEMSQIKRGK